MLLELRSLLGGLSLPRSVLDDVLAAIDRVSADSGVQERRARQFALLESPNPYGQAAIEIAETIDAFDRPALGPMPVGRRVLS